MFLIAPVIAAAAISAGSQLASSAIKKKKAGEQAPQIEDPEMRDFLSQIQRRRRAFQTGSAYQGSLRDIRQTQAGTTRGITRAVGGNVGAVIAGAGRTQRIAGQQYNRLQAMQEQQGRFLTKLQLGVQTRISQRKLDLQNLRQARALAAAAESKSTGTANLLATAAHVLPIGGEGGQEIPIISPTETKNRTTTQEFQPPTTG